VGSHARPYVVHLARDAAPSAGESAAGSGLTGSIRLPRQHQIRPPRNSNADSYRCNEQQYHDQSDQKAAHLANQTSCSVTESRPGRAGYGAFGSFLTPHPATAWTTS
jgi:hypothetical protein